MIQANELRIGNWVRIRESDTKVQVEAYMLNVSELSNCQPIPLTPEILEKCGFERLTHKTEGGYKSSIYSYRGKYSFTVFFDDGKLSVSFWQGNEKQYLHQLQNLYFALTGEELNFNKQ
jgi:hypothetical protein